jgi:hypothetical protein
MYFDDDATYSGDDDNATYSGDDNATYFNGHHVLPTDTKNPGLHGS